LKPLFASDSSGCNFFKEIPKAEQVQAQKAFERKMLRQQKFCQKPQRIIAC
jgi:hypothetical protein